MPPGVLCDCVHATAAALLKTLKEPEFVAEAEKARMTLNPIPRTTMQNMIVEALPSDPCAEGLAGKPVAISESVASWNHRREFFSGSRNSPRA
jgi:hypothetical protein